MKRTIKDWLIILVLLSDEAIAVVALILVLRYFGVELPLPVIIVIGLLLGAIIFITHKAIIPALHRKRVTGSEGMVGLEGEVIKPLTPDGMVSVNGEIWKAKSLYGDIPAGEEIEIVGLKRLTLKVKRKDK